MAVSFESGDLKDFVDFPEKPLFKDVSDAHITNRLNGVAIHELSNIQGVTDAQILICLAAWQRMIRLYDENKELVAQIEGLEARIRQLESEWYQPVEGEPSIFGSGDAPSTPWVLWYSYVFNVGIVPAHARGEEILQQLLAETPRNLRFKEEPELRLIAEPFRSQRIARETVSMTWVIFAKYKRGLDWEEAHADGFIMLRGGRPRSSLRQYADD